MNLNISLAVQLSIISFSLSVILGIALLKKPLSELPRVKGYDLRSVMKLSAPLFVSSASIIVVGEMHLWILGASKSADEVAIYGAAFRMIQFIVVPLSLRNHLIPP